MPFTRRIEESIISNRDKNETIDGIIRLLQNLSDKSLKKWQKKKKKTTKYVL